MKNAFEVKPILVAGVIGAALIALLVSEQEWLYGAMIGAGVQIGVRLIGVS